MQKLFPALQVRTPEQDPLEEQVVCGRDGMGLLADMLRDYACGRISEQSRRQTYTFYHSYQNREQYRDTLDKLIRTAFYRYCDTPLSGMVTRALYGTMLQNSVSRLERYAACAYGHFLQYGLSLGERDEYSFRDVDMGKVFHGVLELFAGKLEEHGYSWFDFPEDTAEKMVSEAIEAYAASYGETILYSSARNRHLIR